MPFTATVARWQGLTQLGVGNTLSEYNVNNIIGYCYLVYMYPWHVETVLLIHCISFHYKAEKYWPRFMDSSQIAPYSLCSALLLTRANEARLGPRLRRGWRIIQQYHLHILYLFTLTYEWPSSEVFFLRFMSKWNILFMVIPNLFLAFRSQ